MVRGGGGEERGARGDLGWDGGGRGARGEGGGVVGGKVRVINAKRGVEGGGGR